MDPIADTMPEARYRTTKKTAQPIRPVSARLTAVLEPAAPTAKAAPAKPKITKKTPGESLVSWWPVGLSIFLCGFVPEWHQTAIQFGVWAERLLFPLTLLAQHREIGISDQMASVAPNVALYLQLPLEGLLTKLTLDRGKGLKAAVVQLILIHLLCAFVLWLLTYLH